MEKKNYQKPAVQVINIGTVAIMQGQLSPFQWVNQVPVTNQSLTRMDGFGLISQPTALS